MTDRPVSRVLSALERATGYKPRRNAKGWMARCLAHDDHNPSLSVAEGDDGRALIKCHAGCTPDAIVAALGMAMRDLMPVDALTAGTTPQNGTPRNVSSASTPKKSARTYATARAAVAELEGRHGPRSADWTYHNANGEPVGIVVRWDRPSGGKNIRPVSKNGSGWIIRGMLEPRPLYALPELSMAKRIYICEGEPAAEALRSVGLTATTSPHGSKSASNADWSVLAGKEIALCPDADDPGRRYADDVTGLLGKLTPIPTVKQIELPDLPRGGDAVEYIAARRVAGLEDDAIRAEIEALAASADPIELHRRACAIATFKPFPVKALPEPMRSFVSEGARAIGCDPSYIALPLLAALASAIGNTRRIQLKRGWAEPAILWTAIVGESGTLKTPPFKLVMKPIRDRQNTAMKGHADDVAAYEASMLHYDKEVQAWKRDRNSQHGPPEKPHPPFAERHVVSDTTIEALVPILQANPRGLLLARDELAGWVASFDRYAGGRGGGDAAHWLSMHNGESVVVDRKTGQPRTVYVPSATVSITGGVQPGILNRVLGPEHRESGLLARLLLAMPPRRVKRWSEAVVSERAEAAVVMIIDRMYGLEPDRGDDGDPHPRIVGLTPEGKVAWIDFYNAHAQEQAELTGDLSAAWSKLEGYAARLALVVHFVRWAADDPTLHDAGAVDETSVAAGVTLSRWFGNEARRVYATFSESEDEQEHRRLVELVERKDGCVSVRNWQRARSHKTSSDAETELNELVEGGYGTWHVPPQAGRGRPTKLFVLVSDVSDASDTDEKPAGNSETTIVSVSETSKGVSHAPKTHTPMMAEPLAPETAYDSAGRPGESVPMRVLEIVEAHGSCESPIPACAGTPGDAVKLMEAGDSNPA